MFELCERFRLVPMMIVMGTIFFLSHQTGDSLDIDYFAGFDKVAHLSAYAVLGLSVIYAHAKVMRLGKPVIVCCSTLSICFLYGLSDEFHQSFVPGRFPSGSDIVADMAGAVIACGIYIFVRKRFF